MRATLIGHILQEAITFDKSILDALKRRTRLGKKTESIRRQFAGFFESISVLES